MSSTMWIILSILILLLIAAAVVFFSRKKKHEVDYYALFILGVIWLPLGIPLDNYALTAIGVVFIAIALVNKGKWKTNRKSMAKMGHKERLVITLATGLLVLAVLATLIYFVFNRYY